MGFRVWGLGNGVPGFANLPLIIWHACFAVKPRVFDQVLTFRDMKKHQA